MTQPHEPLGVSGDEATAQAERVNQALRGYAVPGQAYQPPRIDQVNDAARANGWIAPAQQPRPAAVQPKPKGTVKLTSFLIIVGAITVYVLATHFGWYDQLPSWLDDLK